ncbi:unnamed protein product [Acanthoscelides obtectus]|uniref:Uncharacterized protein n=1 Tax=Acanthoscelides obtectus TaxID=200917 RepID=A0A9P0PYP5_ACAOB|nr:unnamed protein product [Acanthoscelides obtectus]CAK1660486.1 hypothetical protein AOBTE_LOCUS22106 [Acanthoscelides obtectus]
MDIDKSTIHLTLDGDISASHVMFCACFVVLGHTCIRSFHLKGTSNFKSIEHDLFDGAIQIFFITSGSLIHLSADIEVSGHHHLSNIEPIGEKILLNLLIVFYQKSRLHKNKNKTNYDKERRVVTSIEQYLSVPRYNSSIYRKNNRAVSKKNKVTSEGSYDTKRQGEEGVLSGSIKKGGGTDKGDYDKNKVAFKEDVQEPQSGHMKRTEHLVPGKSEDNREKKRDVTYGDFMGLTPRRVDSLKEIEIHRLREGIIGVKEGAAILKTESITVSSPTGGQPQKETLNTEHTQTTLSNTVEFKKEDE